MHPSNRPIARQIVCLLVTALAAGCGVNPIVTRKETAEPAKREGRMNAALGEALALRQSFEERAEAFVGRKIAINDLLFGLGVATFGLVAGKAHRDAFAVTAAIGGSTYLYTTTGLQQAHLTAYQVGIGRLNCAMVVGRALRVDDEVLEIHKTEAGSLRSQLPKLAADIGTAELLVLSEPTLDVDFKSAARQRIDDAKATLAKATEANKAAEVLGDRADKVASKLRGTVNVISEAVNDMAAKGVPEPAAVVESLKSLTKFVGDFGRAVGADVKVPAPVASGAAVGSQESEVGGAIPAVASAPSASSMQDIRTALVKLAEQQATTSLLADAMSERVARYPGSTSDEDFGKCVPDSKVSNFAVSVATINFTASKDSDQSATFKASGGTKNYVADFTTQPTFGIELIPAPPGESTFRVKVPKSVVGPHELLVLIADSSSPPNERSVAIKVAAAAASAPNANESQVGRAATLRDALVRARNFSGSITLGSGAAAATLRVTTVQADASGFRVGLTCTPGAKSAQYTRAEARTKLLALLSSSYGLSAAEAAAVRPAQLDLVDSANCLR
jgi:hypothetical protein